MLIVMGILIVVFFTLAMSSTGIEQGIFGALCVLMVILTAVVVAFRVLIGFGRWLIGPPIPRFGPEHIGRARTVPIEEPANTIPRAVRIPKPAPIARPSGVPAQPVTSATGNRGEGLSAAGPVPTRGVPRRGAPRGIGCPDPRCARWNLTEAKFCAQCGRPLGHA